MVRNEEDVISHVVRHMLNQVDQVVVADNLSTDRTREILDSIKDKRLVVLDDLDPAYRQSEKMTALANDWAAPGDWVVPFDADELWGVPGGGRLGDFLTKFQGPVAAGRPLLHVPQPGDIFSGCPFLAMPWRLEQPEVWPKAALAWDDEVVIEQGNHWTKGGAPEVLDIRHFQYRSYNQFVGKVTRGAVALALTDLPANSGAHWRRLGNGSGAVRDAWWDEYIHQPVMHDPPRCKAQA